MSVLDDDVMAAMREGGLNPDGISPFEAPPGHWGVEPAPAPEPETVPESTPPSVTPKPLEAGGPEWGSVNSVMGFRAGVRDPEPPPETVGDIAFGDRDLFRLGYTRNQANYAVLRKTPAERMNHYARMDDVRRMAETAEKHSVMSGEELDATAARLDMPPNLVAMMKDHYPDELERRKLFAKMLDVAGDDSYFALRFSRDPSYAAVMRGHEMAFADLQAAVKGVYASAPEIMWGWGVNAARNILAETGGIPARLSGITRDVRNLPRTPEAEVPVPDAAADPAGNLMARAVNFEIGRQNAMMESLAAEPGSPAPEQALNRLDDWLRNAYEDDRAKTYAGEVKTGSWLLDDWVKPAVEAAPSVAMSAAETALLGPLAPLIHFGLLAQGESYREMRAEGVPADAALIGSSLRGLFEGGAESLQGGRIIKGTGARKIIGSLFGPSTSAGSRLARVGVAAANAAGDALVNAGQEIVQGAGGIAAARLAKSISLGDPYANVFSAIYEKGGDLLKEGWGVIPITLLTGGMFGGAAGELSAMRKYNAFQKAVTPLAAAGDAAVKGGKSVAEARREVRTMIHAEAAGGNAGTTAYADPGDVELYLQGKPREEAKQTLAKIGVTPEILEQAKTDQTDIEVPLENIAVQEGGSDPELTGLFRPTPNMAAASMIAQRTRENAGVYEQARELRKLIDADVEGKTIPPAVQAFRQDLKARLNYKADEADFTASVVWSYAKAQSERRGVDVDQFLSDSLLGNIRAAMDAWINLNPSWLAGVRARPVAGPAPETVIPETVEPVDDAAHDVPPLFAQVQERAGTAVRPERYAQGGIGEPFYRPEDLDAVNGKTGEIVSISISEQTQGKEDLRAQAFEEIKKHQGERPRNRETGWDILINRRGVDKSIHEPRTDIELLAIGKIPELLAKAVKAGVSNYEKGDTSLKERGIKGYHRFYAPLLVNDKDLYAVQLTVKERFEEGHSFYLHRMEISNPAAIVANIGDETPTRAGPAGSQYSIEQLLLNVNPDDANPETFRSGIQDKTLGVVELHNGELTARQAAAIAAAAPGDPAIQDMMVERKTPVAEMETFAGYVRKMQRSGALNLDGVQLSLFAGKDHDAMLAAMEKESRKAAEEAMALDRKANGLESLLKVGKTLTTAELRKHGARAGDREGLRMEAAELHDEAGRWRNFFHHPDILAQVQERAGTAVRPVESYQQGERKNRRAAVEIRDGQFVVADPTEAARRLRSLEKMPAVAIANELTNIHYGEIQSDPNQSVREANPPRNDSGHSNEDSIQQWIDSVKSLSDPIKSQAPGGLQSLPGVSSTSRIPSPNLIGDSQLHGRTASSPEDGRFGAAKDTIDSAEGLVNPEDSAPETFRHEIQGEIRGEVELHRADATHRQAAVIRVMKNGDMSTVLHELAHVFLADMRDYVAAGNADIDTVRDYGKLLNAAGDLAKGEANEGNVEQVARWFEEYLREGKAPSIELVRPFGLFSKWLSNVYGSVRQYVGREMNAGVRGVFDRWLASERDIAEAEAYYGGLKSANFLNLIDDEEKRKKLADELENNRRRVMNRHAGEMARSWTRANAGRDRLAEEAEREIGESPVYRAVREAKALGLDRAAAEATVGKDTVIRIIDAHGDVFKKTDRPPVDPKPILRRAGYHEANPENLFLEELARAVPVAEAVRKEGSQARRKRYYSALDEIARAGGIDPDALPDINELELAALERHPGLFRTDGRENMDRIAMAAGFRTPSAMLGAMAKAPAFAAMTERLAGRKARERARAARAWAEENIAGVMDDTRPSMQESFHDPDEDAVADAIELQRDALRDAIAARTGRRQAYVSRRAMDDGAKRTLFGKSLRDAMNYNNHAKAERYWSAAAAEAMANGDREAALAALDKQQRFHALTAAAFRIRRDYTDFMRRYGRRMARSELSAVESIYRDSVRDILTFTGVVVDRSGRFTPENVQPDRLLLPKAARDEFDDPDGTGIDASIESFHPDMETLLPEWLRLKILPRGYMGNVLDLTPAHMADIDASVKTLIKYGREELTALRDGDDRRVSDIRDKLTAVMETLPKRKALRPDKKKWDRIKSGMDSCLAGNLNIDALAEEMDGFSMHQGKGMGLMQTLVDAVRNGEVRQMEMLERFRTATARPFRTLDGMVARLKKTNGGTFFNPDGVPSPAELTDNENAPAEWDPGMLLAVMFNAGNRGNLYALQQGYGLNDAELNRLFSLATEQEWLAVQRVAKEMENLFPGMDAVHYALTSRHLEKVQPEKIWVETADGKDMELDGWYYPLVFDPALSDGAAQNAGASDYRAVMSAIFNPRKLRDGFAGSRVIGEEGSPVFARPPLLNARVIVDHMTAATRWISLAESLMDFRRVTMDPEFRKIFVQRLGNRRYRDLRMWTNRMARPDRGIDGGMNRLVRRLRNASAVAALGVNLRSAVCRLSSGGLAVDEMSRAGGGGMIGWRYMWRGLRKMGLKGSVSLLLSPLGFAGPATEEMFRLSPEARRRAGNVDKEIRDVLNSFNPRSGTFARKWAGVRESLFHFTASVDRMVSGAAWWGAYEQAGAGNAGFDVKGLAKEEIEAKAVACANRVVRIRQSPYQADHARLRADNGAVSLLAQFMAGLAPYLNSACVNVQLARRLGWRGNVSLGTHLLNAYIIPSVAMAMLSREICSRLAGDDGDEEECGLEWDFAEEMVGQSVGDPPGIRDVARLGTRTVGTGRTKYSSPGAAMPPAVAMPARVASSAASAVDNLPDGDAYAAGKDMGMAAAEILLGGGTGMFSQCG